MATRPSTHSVSWVIVTSACACWLFAIKIWDWDDWWHLGTGRWIVENGEIPYVDPFSYTATGQPMTGFPWLAELALYGAHDVAGPAGLVILQVICAFATLTLVGMTLRELDVDPRVSAGLVLLTAVLVQERYARARPETIAAVFLAAGVWLVVRWWQRNDRSIVGLAPLTLLWIPIHASATLAPALLASVIAAMAFNQRQRLLLPIATMAVVLAAFGLTQTGRDLVEFGLRSSRGASPVAIGITEEWRRPTLADGSIWIPLLMTLASVATCAAKRRRDAVLPVGLALIGLFFAGRSIRHIAPAVLLSVPAWGLAARSLRAWLLNRPWPLAARVLPWTIGLGLSSGHVGLSPLENNRVAFGFGVVENRFPSDSVDVLESLPPGRTIHEMHFGGYLIWRRIPVFWDGRTVSLYTDQQIVDFFLPAERDEASLERVADHFSVKYGLSTIESPLGALMMTSNDWIPVLHGRVASLYVRRKYASELAGAGIPLLTTLRFTPSWRWNEHWYGRVLSDPVGRADLLQAIRHQHDRNPKAPALLGALQYLEGRDPAFYASIGEAPP
jgi:hypothetical protein